MITSSDDEQEEELDFVGEIGGLMNPQMMAFNAETIDAEQPAQMAKVETFKPFEMTYRFKERGRENS